mmetsp:Transcript_4729/g.16969  ORF Transcript_4729/g.16969 Transcript_4729/m.16969 type:complete len:221 (+) Transcript_4729:1123-1785(+)
MTFYWRLLVSRTIRVHAVSFVWRRQSSLTLEPMHSCYVVNAAILAELVPATPLHLRADLHPSHPHHPFRSHQRQILRPLRYRPLRYHLLRLHFSHPHRLLPSRLPLLHPCKTSCLRPRHPPTRPRYKLLLLLHFPQRAIPPRLRSLQVMTSLLLHFRRLLAPLLSQSTSPIRRLRRNNSPRLRLCCQAPLTMDYVLLSGRATSCLACMTWMALALSVSPT